VFDLAMSYGKVVNCELWKKCYKLCDVE